MTGQDRDGARERGIGEWKVDRGPDLRCLACPMWGLFMQKCRLSCALPGRREPREHRDGQRALPRKPWANQRPSPSSTEGSVAAGGTAWTKAGGLASLQSSGGSTSYVTPSLAVGGEEGRMGPGFPAGPDGVIHHRKNGGPAGRAGR